LGTRNSQSNNTEARTDVREGRKGREGRKESKSRHGLSFANLAFFAGHLLFPSPDSQAYALTPMSDPRLTALDPTCEIALV
jgi:hypothetical protein